MTSDRGWPRGWEDHELAQLRRLAKLSLSEKIDWLEQAHRVVQQLAKARDAQNPSAPNHSASPPEGESTNSA
jgi:hypothetical protein